MNTSQKNILLVDADAVLCEDLARAFTGANYHVVTAANGHEAFQKVAGTTIDATLLDLDRPDDHRWKTIRFLSSNNPSMSAIGLTARSDRNSLANAAGLEALLEKPVNVSLVLETINELILKESSRQDSALAMTEVLPK